jgi:hypothetical protein
VKHPLFRYLVLALFTQIQMSDMAQLLRAKELHSIVAQSLLVYDYAYDTEVDRLFFDHF